MSEDLVIVGASARAAVFSAFRANFSPWAIDAFADADLKIVCPALRANPYPGGIEEQMRNTPPAARWLYTGGLENHFSLLQRLARQRPLFGNPAQTARAVRDPLALAEALWQRELKFPRTLPPGTQPPSAGTWLAKTYRGSGGLQVRRWPPAAAWNRDRVYAQRFIDGESYGAIYVGNGTRANLLGVTRQWVGQGWTFAAPFQYCGSIGPLDLPRSVTRQFVHLGGALAEQFGLRGLFGVDTVFDGRDLWTIEVNPRYTAAVEVLERRGDLLALARHVRGCAGRLEKVDPPGAGPLAGKAVLYAAADLSVSPSQHAWLMDQRGAALRPQVADIPPPGTAIAAGGPIVTIFASATTAEQVQCELQELSHEVYLRLGDG